MNAGGPACRPAAAAGTASGRGGGPGVSAIDPEAREGLSGAPPAARRGLEKNIIFSPNLNGALLGVGPGLRFPLV